MTRSIRTTLLLSAVILAGCNGSSDSGQDAPGGTNAAPVAMPLSLTTQTDTPITGSLKATDKDGDTLRFALGNAPGQGTVVITPGGTVTYTPASGITGNDQFSYTVSDGNNEPVSAQVSITIEVLQVSFASFSREVFNAPLNSTPKSLRGRSVSNDVSSPDFYDDLLME
ncbi:Ig-like domain-containing protein [Photobacterium salinisoli]|uniref:Ig-like domain-containing protein n=1 Tax=Photobacterium salinisoli TaxID=1616783 RepID=UPI000EA30A79|nr:Ig-like domain-containing protein [Photobacterium salinisoli]